MKSLFIRRIQCLNTSGLWYIYSSTVPAISRYTCPTWVLFNVAHAACILMQWATFLPNCYFWYFTYNSLITFSYFHLSMIFNARLLLFGSVYVTDFLLLLKWILYNISTLKYLKMTTYLLIYLLIYLLSCVLIYLCYFRCFQQWSNSEKFLILFKLTEDLILLAGVNFQDNTSRD